MGEVLGIPRGMGEIAPPLAQMVPLSASTITWQSKITLLAVSLLAHARAITTLALYVLAHLVTKNPARLDLLKGSMLAHYAFSMKAFAAVFHADGLVALRAMLDVPQQLPVVVPEALAVVAAAPPPPPQAQVPPAVEAVGAPVAPAVDLPALPHPPLVEQVLFPLVDHAQMEASLRRSREAAVAQMQAERPMGFAYAPASARRVDFDVLAVGDAFQAAAFQSEQPNASLYLAENFLVAGQEMLLCGVVEPHGRVEAAQFIKVHLRRTFEEILASLPNNLTQDEAVFHALRQLFQCLHERFLVEKRQVLDVEQRRWLVETGATCIVSLIVGEEIWTASLGGGGALQVTRDGGFAPLGVRSEVVQDDPLQEAIFIQSVGFADRANLNREPVITKAPLLPEATLFWWGHKLFEHCSTEEIVHALTVEQSEPRELVYSIALSAQRGMEVPLTCLLLKAAPPSRPGSPFSVVSAKEQSEELDISVRGAPVVIEIQTGQQPPGPDDTVDTEIDQFLAAMGPAAATTTRAASSTTSGSVVMVDRPSSEEGALPEAPKLTRGSPSATSGSAVVVSPPPEAPATARSSPVLVEPPGGTRASSPATPDDEWVRPTGSSSLDSGTLTEAASPAARSSGAGSFVVLSSPEEGTSRREQ